MKRVAVLLIVAVALGVWVGRTTHRADSVPAETAEPTVQHWTCSMHPEIRLPEFGRCPICAMDLIPVGASGGDDAGLPILEMTPTAVQLAQIRTTPVRRTSTRREVRLVGTIAVDETRQRTITAWVPGRLDRMFVDFTGVNIRNGDHMVQIYSPDLVTAQSELLAAKRASETAAQLSSRVLPGVAQSTLDAAREKLALLGLSQRQIDEIEASGEVQRTITINAPIDGVVYKKLAVEGMYVETGTPLYEIVDLQQVWALIEVYENDLSWIRFGQKLSFEAEAFPGETFEGTIAFIDPVLDPHTRTTRIRVNVRNHRQRLKPGMFVRATLEATLGESSQVLDANLSSKWMCPMHPDEIGDGPGRCGICEMPRVPARELGFEESGPVTSPLVVPHSAPLITGDRAIVYVQLMDRREPTFEGREVQLAERIADGYVVKAGLREGEHVVVNGAFKIDSAMQIQAKPSMMSARTGAVEENPMVTSYLALQEALANDDFAAAIAAAEGLDSDDSAVRAAAAQVATATDVETARANFETLSLAVLEAVRRDGSDRALSRVHCPMAFDNRGADWLQIGHDVRNPYFGASMLACGTVEETIQP